MGSDRTGFVQALDAALAKSGVVGAAVGVARGDARWFEVRGALSVDDARPVTPQTPFQLGSVAKAYTALALMRLVDAGRLDLDAPVRAYLPNFAVGDAGAGESVTTRQLLAHTAGWEGDFCRDTGHGPDALARALAAMDTLPQLHAPGAMWSYCNSAYYVASRLVEVLTGAPYAAALARLVLEPLDLRATGFGRALLDAAAPVAAGHVIGASGPARSDTWGLPRALQGVAGVAASAEDLLTFACFHLHDGAPLLGAGRLDTLLRPVDGLPRGAPRQALAWRRALHGGVDVVEIGGSTSSQGGMVMLVPARGLACVVLANTNTAGAFAERIKRAALTLAGVERAPAAPTPAPLERVRASVGRYENPTHDVVLALDDSGGQLTAQVTFKRGGFPWNTVEARQELPALPCTLYDDGRLSVLPGTLLERGGRVLEGADREPQWVLLHARAHRRVA